jgi:hypothetical protein
LVKALWWYTRAFLSQGSSYLYIYHSRTIYLIMHWKGPREDKKYFLLWLLNSACSFYIRCHKYISSKIVYRVPAFWETFNLHFEVFFASHYTNGYYYSLLSNRHPWASEPKVFFHDSSWKKKFRHIVLDFFFFFSLQDQLKFDYKTQVGVDR